MHFRLLTKVGLLTQKLLTCLPEVVVACMVDKYSTVSDSTSAPELAVDAREQRMMAQDGEGGLD